MIETNKIYNIDMFEGHKLIDDKSIDMIYTDLPYNTTHNKWDVKIDLEQLWCDYKRIIKPNGVIILHCQGMFTAELMTTNKKMWKYNLIWKKGERVTQFLNSKRKVLPNHEDIAIFYDRQCTYNPIMTEGIPLHSKGKKYLNKEGVNNNYGYYDTKIKETRAGSTEKYPKSILNFNKPHPAIFSTQKPIELAEWLITTFSNENEIILDSCVGSGTSIIACKKLKRNFIGFEKDDVIFKLALNRIELPS